MGGAASKGTKSDDAPPAGRRDDAAKAAAKSAPSPAKKAKDDAKQAKAETKAAKKFAAVEKKVQKVERTRVDDDVSDDDEEGGGAYDSDLDRELEHDAEMIGTQEPEDDHKRLTIQDRVRADAMEWSTQVLPPSDFTPVENSEYRPEESVGLDFVHGYHGWDCLSNLFYTVTEEVCYFAAGLGIVYEPKSGRQKHYQGPSNRRLREANAMAMHPSGSIVATAERAFDANIFIWDLSTLSTLRVLPGHKNGVSAMAFSKDGKRLVSAGMDPEKTVMVWEWKSDKRAEALCKVSLKTSKIFALGYNPRDDVVVACGTSMIEFLRVGLSRTGQRVIEHLPGVYSVTNRATHGVSPTMLCCAFTKTEFSLAGSLKNAVEGLCITGSEIGNIYLWKREEQIDMIVAAHKGPVYTISTFVNGFVSGGKDGKVRLWNNDLEPERAYDISAAALTEVVIKAIDHRTGSVLVGTASSEIFELDQETGEVELLARGHSAKEVSAVASHPTKPLYASVGDDAALRLWDLARRREWKHKPLEAAGRSVHFSPDGKLVAVGHSNGSWSVHRLDTMDEVIATKDRKKDIHAIRFSPNGRYLAAGSEDCMIDLYDCVSDYDWMGSLQGHTHAIKHIDWSTDSRNLQSAGEAQELFSWDVETQQMLPSFEAARDIEWDSWSCTIGWPVQGMVGAGYANTSACRSLSSHLIASANTDGLVRVYRFPCTVSGAEDVPCSGHVGEVRDVCFSFDDTYLFSVASADRSVLQWRVSSEGDIGFDDLDPTALTGLEDAGLNQNRKDIFEQSRFDKRQRMLEAQKVPMMDPGKAVPGKEDKGRGKDVAKGEGEGADEQEQQEAEKKNALENPGQPENLPEVDEEIEEQSVVKDSDVEKEIGMKYFRGPTAETESAGGGPDGLDILPQIGQPLFAVKSAAMAIPPTSYKKPDDADDPPDSGLQMEFVYGTRGHDTRGTIMYTGRGEVVFVAGATGIIYNPVQHTQKFFNGHTDDIICLGMHPDFNIVATGQVGRKALLCVWNTFTMQTLTVLRGFHDHGICAVSFSSAGDKLVSVGIDQDHSIAVWNWETGAKIASATGHVHRIFCVAFNPADDSIVTTGVSHVKFWNVTGRLLRGKSGAFNQGQRDQAMVSLTISKKGRIYSGSEQGEIYRWKNAEVDTLVMAHEGPVFALWVCRDGLCSGGKDGKVMVWSLNLKPLVTFDLRSQSTGLDRTRIRSVCWLAKTILVGTIHSEVFEIDIESGTPSALLTGHSAGKVNGLQTHPSKRVFVTGAEDKTVRVWDMDTRRQINIKTMEAAVCTVAISLDGSHIAAGLEDGKLVILKARSLRPAMERKDRKKALTETKYSANGKFLAVGSQDGFIDLYDVMSDYEWIGTCQGHKSAVACIDWSNDSKLLMSDDRTGLHIFWDVESTKEIMVAAEVRDVEWASFTATQGWPAQGIGPKFQGATGINTSCRSSFGDSIATGDDWGVVKLFRYPCITPGARCKRYGGHSSRVGKIRFSFEEKTVVSTGWVDGLVIQWRYLSAGKLLEQEQVVSDDEEEMEFEVKATISDEHQDSDVENELSTRFGRGNSEVKVDKTGMMQVKSHRMVTGNEVVTESQETRLNMKSAVDDEDDKARNKKDWRKPMDADEAPYNVLQMEHVYGFRGHDCRNNLMYTGKGKMVYMVAAICVVYDKSSHFQTFYNAHTDDVISIAMHPDQETIATGQVGKTPIIQVWSATTMQTLVTLRGFHEMGVASVAFSKDGSKIASVGLDLDHSIAVWDWRRGARLATAPGHTDKIFEVRYNPVDDVLVSCGVRHIKFWTLVGDNQLRAKRGIYGQEGVQQTMLCVAFPDGGLALTGAQTGDIFLWKGANLEWQFEQAHTGPIFAISTYPDGFLSGGKDGRVRLWSGLDPVKVFDFSSTSVASTVQTRIRSAVWRDGHVLVGTMSNEIFEVDERTMTQRLIVQSHAGAEVWGLSTHPNQALFVTGGDDRTVRVFKVSSRKPVMVRELEDAVRCVAYNHDGTQVAAGLANGKMMVLEPKKLEEICSRHTREQPLTDIKFSPDGRYVATTCLDGALDVYDSLVDFDLIGTASTRGGAGLTHMDWSADGMFIQTDNTVREHQYWDALSVLEKVDGEESLSRVEWATWTCVYGWSVMGLTPKFGEAVGINACCRSNKGEVLAVANDFGLIRLFRFPAPYQGCKHKRYAGHSSLVTNCRFTFDDKYLISVGGTDRCIFQWEHIPD